MKKLHTWLAATTLILAGCSTTDTLDDLTHREISFAANVGKSTKTGPIAEGALPTTGGNANIGVYAFHKPAGGTYDYSTPIMADEPVIFTNNAWRSETPFYWPNSGTLKFVAYTPDVKVPVTDYNTTDGLILKDFESTPSIDLMYSDFTTDYTVGPVSLTLHHALTQVYFAIKTNVPDAIFHIVEFGIYDVVGKGTFHSHPTPSWTLSTDPDDQINFYQIYRSPLDESAQAQISRATGAHQFSTRLMLIPQPVSRIQLMLTYRVTDPDGTPILSQTTRTINLSGANWLPNQRIKYTIELLGTGINEIIFAPSVGAWTAELGYMTPQ